MLKGIKVRIYPSEEQRNNLNSLLGSCRFVYNKLLEHKQRIYKESNVNVSFSEMSKKFHGEYRDEYSWLKLVNTKVVKQSIRNLDQAYTNFFTHGRGLPKFKSKRNKEKCIFPAEAVSKTPFNKETNKINLTKNIKNLKFKCSDKYREYLENNKGGIRSVTVSKEKNGHYYASILIEGNVRRKIKQPTNESVGIDLGVKTLAFYSNGCSEENLKHYKGVDKKLKRVQRSLSRKVNGSSNHEKTRIKLNKIYKRIKNQKTSYLHNITSKIIKENQIIVLEDLSVNEMYSANNNFNRAIQNVGFYEFKRQLGYKSSWYNRDLIIINKWFASSKTCSSCGWKNNNLKLSDRIFDCKECGLSIDRDYNAALNIEREGLTSYYKQIGHRVSDLKPVDSLTIENRLKSNFRFFINCNDYMKQEENVAH